MRGCNACMCMFHVTMHNFIKYFFFSGRVNDTFIAFLASVHDTHSLARRYMSIVGVCVCAFKCIIIISKLLTQLCMDISYDFHMFWTFNSRAVHISISWNAYDTHMMLINFLRGCRCKILSLARWGQVI